MFLKYLDDLEKDKATAAELTGMAYTNIIAPEFQWSKWAAPKLALSWAEGDKEGKLDHHKALSGDDLADFVNIQLFPYLKKFKADAESEIGLWNGIGWTKFDGALREFKIEKEISRIIEIG